MTSGGAWALRTAATLDEVNVHLAQLESAGLLGIAEEDGTATVYLRQRLDPPPVPGTWEQVPPRDWNAAWKADLQPVRVGRITVVAPWHEPPADGITLVVEPAQAFGTGHHETTTRCLQALQDLDLRDVAVLDVGTGTGILALAAARLGASTVVAVDVDPIAVRTALDNAAANGVAVEVHEGSADALDATFEVVVANLDTATLSAVAPHLAARLAPGGTLVASGVSNERSNEAVAALRAEGIDCESSRGDEWAVLVGRRTR